MRYFTFSPSRHLLLNPLNHHSLHRLWWGIGSFHYHLLVIVAYQHLSSVLVLGRHHFLVIRDIVCFHFSFWLHRHVFVARISYSCRHGMFRGSFLFRCWILVFIVCCKRSIVRTLLLTLHISVLFHFGVLPPYGYLLAPVTFSIAKLRQADYRKYRMVLFASQKDWQPSALYI